MSHKDYQAIARVLEANRASYAYHREWDLASAIDGVTYDLANVLQADNPAFDRERFLIAAGAPR